MNTVSNNLIWPARIFELSRQSWENYTLQAAIKLDIFSLIDSENESESESQATATVEKLKEKLKANNHRGIEMLLNALTAMKLLIKKDNHFMLTAAAKTFLIKNADNYLGNIILHHHELAKSWLNLDQSILSGTANRSSMSKQPECDEKTRENFLMGMFNLAMMNAPKIVSCFDFSSKKTLLDLGGGPGTYAINFCLKSPALNATVFDLPTTKPYALKTIKKYNLEDRIEFVAGDFNTDKIPGKYDVAWLSHILHSEGPENATAIVKKAAASLNAGGFLLIHEFILDEGNASPLHPTLFSLNMLIGTENGRSYNQKELSIMLESCGLINIEVIEIESAPSKIIKAQAH